MGDIVNLRQVRKTLARANAEKKAAENRVIFGQTKAEKSLRKAEEKRADKVLAAGRIDNPEKDPGSNR